MNHPQSPNHPPQGSQQPYGNQPPQGDAPYGQPVGTPGIVIAGFILAFLCAPVGLILSIIGKGKCKEIGAPTGLATAGIVISAVFLAVGIIQLILGVAFESTAAGS